MFCKPIANELILNWLVAIISSVNSKKKTMSTEDIGAVAV